MTPLLAETAPPDHFESRKGHSLDLVRLWILICMGINLLGWALAWTGQLNARGYWVGFVTGGALLVWSVRRGLVQIPSSSTALKLVKNRRWRRPLPFIYALLYMMIVAGAALHAPNNYDALTYRLPQVLHWLAAQRWHWIAVSDRHINITPPGYGWFMAPMIALLKTDRFFALPNLVAFVLLPGLYFSVLRQCGVAGRVAWYWMWLMPTASCLAMQAGGMGNDLLPGVYALAALALGFRAMRRSSLEDFLLSALAAALVTGVKIPAAPLALPWLVITLPCWKLVPRRWFVSLGTACIAVVISFLPTAVNNTLHTGSWSGDPENQLKLRIDSPVHAIAGNTVMILVGAIEPPLCPVADKVESFYHTCESSRFGTWLRQEYPRFELHCGELAREELSGLGLGLTLLGILTLPGLGKRQQKITVTHGPDWGRWMGLASLAAFGVYLSKMGSEAAPRLAAPFYPFIFIPLLRTPIQERLTLHRWWRILACAVALSILPAVFLTPSRPLWPANRILARLSARFPASSLIARSELVYSVYAHRGDDIAPLAPLLPTDGRVVGYVREKNDIEAPLWKPYGSRRVVELMPPVPDFSILKKGSVIIGSSAGIEQQFQMKPADFASVAGGLILGRASIFVKASGGAEEWVVIGPNDSALRFVR